MDAHAAVSPVSSSMPVLTKLLIKNGWHPHILPLMQRSGVSLTHLRFVLPLDADGAEVAEAIVRHCPSTWYLKVGDPDSAFFHAIAQACDDGRFRRLRQLSVCHTKRMDRGTFTLASLSLLQLLCDPSRRLTQGLEVLEMLVPRQEAPVIKQAMDLMLRCNSSIAVAELETCEHSRHAATSEDTATEGDVTATDAAVRRTLSEMVALAGVKVAIPNGDVLPDVIIPPSLRCRLALVSVLARGGAEMPEAVLRNVFVMAGRHTRRLTRL